MKYAIILAGGRGTRFWPLSSESEPKQFLAFSSALTMIEETLCRLKGFIKSENIYIATGRQHAQRIKKYTRGMRIPSGNLFLEPQGKNTLAPIAVLSSRVYAKDKDAVVAVLPCDHLIRKKDKFLLSLKDAMDVAEKGHIVTLGVKPTRPETGYGYIKINPKSKIQNPKVYKKVYKVDKFIEKPDISKAKKLIKDKRYYWNCGMFIFQAGVILEEIRRFVPEIYNLIIKIKNKRDLNRLWRRFPSISLDYAVMEKTKKALLVPARFFWSDLGSWDAVCDVFPKDKKNNIMLADNIDLGSNNIFVCSNNPKRLIATVGIQDLIIVDTKDALLVCKKQKAQEVKQVVEILKEKRKTCV